MELARKPLKFVNQPFLNIVILNLTISDMFLWSGYYLISPILALFLQGKLGDDAARVVGIGVGIYFFVRSVFQLPIGITMDRLKNYVDEAFFVGFGAMFMGLSIFGYQFVESEVHTYLLQFVFGFGTAMNVPA